MIKNEYFPLNLHYLSPLLVLLNIYSDTRGGRMSEQHDKTDAQNNPEATPIDDNQTQTQESVTIDIDSASVETLSPEQTRIFELENEFKVHPNPSIDIWNITGTTIPIKQIIVYDLIGKEVFTSQPNELHTVINGQNFSSGIYFANLVTSQGRLVVKLIKD